MFQVFAPSFDGVEIFPGGYRNETTALGDTFKAFNTDEALDPLNVLAQQARQFEVAVLIRGIGLKLKKDNNHDRVSGYVYPAFSATVRFQLIQSVTPIQPGNATTTQYQLSSARIPSRVADYLEPVVSKSCVWHSGHHAS